MFLIDMHDRHHPQHFLGITAAAKNTVSALPPPPPTLSWHYRRCRQHSLLSRHYRRCHQHYLSITVLPQTLSWHYPRCQQHSLSITAAAANTLSVLPHCHQLAFLPPPPILSWHPDENADKYEAINADKNLTAHRRKIPPITSNVAPN